MWTWRHRCFELRHLRRDLGVADQGLTFQDACDQQADDNHDDGQFDKRKARLCPHVFLCRIII